MAQEVSVLIGFSVQSSSDCAVAPDVIRQLEFAVESLLNKARALVRASPDAFSKLTIAGIATGALRRASNGHEIVSLLNAKYGINVRIITQEEEGRLGYLTACTVAGVRLRDMEATVWDSGGASFQLTRASTGGTGAVTVLKGPIGTSHVTHALVERIQKKGSFEKTKDPNPCSCADIEELREWILSELAPLRDKIGCGFVTEDVLCLGGSPGMFFVASVITGTLNLEPGPLWTAIQQKLVGRTTAEIESVYGIPGGMMAVPNVCLAVAVMQLFGIQRVRQVVTNGSCIGVASDEDFWV